MILPSLVALPTALGPLLRGSWDVWAQSLVHLVSLSGLTLWLVFRVLAGYVPLPSHRNLTWTGLVLGLGAFSVALSPIHALALPEWYNLLNAVWMIPAMAALSKDERFYIDEAIRISAWVLMMLAVYQHTAFSDSRPASALVNVNVYAGAILLLLPLAVEKKDWLLAAGLVLNLWWSHSVGAWLGLSATLVLTSRWRNGRWFWVGLTGCLVCLMAIYNKFDNPEVLNRWQWWKAAAFMIFDRPLFGYGPSSYGYVFPAYSPEGGLATLYAHQYFLQTAAEYGVLFSIVWFAGLWHCLTQGRSYKRFGAIAILIHSFWDWPLSMPSNLWLFVYFAASSLPEEPYGINIRSRYKFPVSFVVLALSFFLIHRTWNFWACAQAKALAAYYADLGQMETAKASAQEAVSRLPKDPESHWILASMEIRLAAGNEDPRLPLMRAVQALESAVRLNPHRARTWVELVSVYEKLGLRGQAADARQRSRPWFRQKQLFHEQ